MWLLFKLKDELTERNKAKKRNGKNASENICEFFLNRVTEKNRQESLKGLGKDDHLELDQSLRDGILEFEVFTSDKKSIGIIPLEVSGEVESAVSRGLKPDMTSYTVTKDEDGMFNCRITLVLKIDEIWIKNKDQ